jgi:hypothetical protein
MVFQDETAVDQALSALGEQLAAVRRAPIDILVCGGSALHALRLITRSTKDVDVVAVVATTESGALSMSSAEPMPAHFVEAAAKVARDLQLKDDWINPGPTSALQFGLPDGVLDRAQARTYGPCLTARFISRYDQVHFKLYAAVDQAGKHYQDLLALRPSADELERAARWSMTHDVSDAYKGDVKRILTEMGHGEVARRL